VTGDTNWTFLITVDVSDCWFGARCSHESIPFLIGSSRGAAAEVRRGCLALLSTALRNGLPDMSAANLYSHTRSQRKRHLTHGHAHQNMTTLVVIEDYVNEKYYAGCLTISKRGSGLTRRLTAPRMTWLPYSLDDLPCAVDNHNPLIIHNRIRQNGCLVYLLQDHQG